MAMPTMMRAVAIASGPSSDDDSSSGIAIVGVETPRSGRLCRETLSRVAIMWAGGYTAVCTAHNSTDTQRQRASVCAKALQRANFELNTSRSFGRMQFEQ